MIRKLITPAIICLFALGAPSCKKAATNEPPAGPMLLTVDFQAYYNNTGVQYFIDDWKATDGVVSTSPFTGLAYRHEMKLTAGRHKLRIVVADKSKDTVVDLQKPLFIGVSFQDRQIELIPSDTKFMYY